MRIEGVAMRVQGVVYKLPPPYRHYHLYRVCWSRGIDPIELGEEQGFYILGGIFIDREMAGKIALATGQIEKLKYSNLLYSEDVW